MATCAHDRSPTGPNHAKVSVTRLSHTTPVRADFAATGEFRLVQEAYCPILRHTYPVAIQNSSTAAWFGGAARRASTLVTGASANEEVSA